jgi:hypothetical protein
LADFNYNGDLVDLNARVGQVLQGTAASGQEFRNALLKLNQLEDGCVCCEEAAGSSSDAASAYVQYIIALGANLGVPTVDLTATFNTLVQQLEDTLALAFETVSCKPCEDRKPGYGSGHGYGPGPGPVDKCCVAINAAISVFTTSLIRPLENGLLHAGETFPDAVNLAIRVDAVINALFKAGGVATRFNAAIRDLLLVKKGCKCCKDVATTIAIAASSYAQDIMLIGFYRGVLTEQLGVVFGNLLTQLGDTLNVARATIKCPICPPPPCPPQPCPPWPCPPPEPYPCPCPCPCPPQNPVV